MKYGLTAHNHTTKPTYNSQLKAYKGTVSLGNGRPMPTRQDCTKRSTTNLTSIYKNNNKSV